MYQLKLVYIYLKKKKRKRWIQIFEGREKKKTLLIEGISELSQQKSISIWKCMFFVCLFFFLLWMRVFRSLENIKESLNFISPLPDSGCYKTFQHLPVISSLLDTTLKSGKLEIAGKKDLSIFPIFLLKLTCKKKKKSELSSACFRGFHHYTNACSYCATMSRKEGGLLKFDVFFFIKKFNILLSSISLVLTSDHKRDRS